MQTESARYGVPSQTVPPFDKTRTIQTIVDTKGQAVHVELHAKIDKGFFKADHDWTCYRRNYFSVACSYTLKPPYVIPSEHLYLNRSNSDHIRALAICITARVSGDEGKPIDLVQHTPKRDKGPLGRPEKIKLMPSPPGSLGIYSEPAGLSPGSQMSPPDYDSSYAASSPNAQQTQTTANFDRIQFKNATANNGKRRAAQQYFNIVVELFAELSGGAASEGQWVKVASRTSARMVVRGRSPGHYSDDRRSSSTSMGPGGGSGGDSSASGPQESNSSGPPGGSRTGLAGISYSGSSRLGSSAYHSHHASLNHSPPESRSSGSSSYDSVTGVRLERPDYPVLSAEDASAIQDYEGYQYYPSTLYESNVNGCSVRPQLPPVRTSTFKSEIEPSVPHHDSFGYYSNSPGNHHTNPDSNRSIKTENHDSSHVGLAGPQYASANRLWALNSAGASPSGGRGCGRFQGVHTSRGYYPESPAV